MVGVSPTTHLATGRHRIVRIISWVPLGFLLPPLPPRDVTLLFFPYLIVRSFRGSECYSRDGLSRESAANVTMEKNSCLIYSFEFSRARIVV